MVGRESKRMGREREGKRKGREREYERGYEGGRKEGGNFQSSDSICLIGIATKQQSNSQGKGR